PALTFRAGTGRRRPGLTGPQSAHHPAVPALPVVTSGRPHAFPGALPAAPSRPPACPQVHACATVPVHCVPTAIFFTVWTTHPAACRRALGKAPTPASPREGNRILVSAASIAARCASVANGCRIVLVSSSVASDGADAPSSATDASSQSGTQSLTSAPGAFSS